MHSENIDERVPAINLLVVCSFIMLAGGLWVDMFTGFFVLEVGLDLKLSLIYKLIMLFVIFNIITMLSIRVATVVFFILTGLLFSTGVMFLNFGQLNLFLKDLAAALKLIVPVTIFSYLFLIAKYDLNILIKWGRLALWSNFIALNVNLFIGLLGFGYKSYEFGNGEGIGINGYYTAGNELGGVFVLFFSYALIRAWDKNKFLYLLLSILTLIWGVLIATKTTILSSILLVSLIPIFAERNLFFFLTPLKLILTSFLLFMSVFSYIYISPMLSSLTIWERFVWIYESKGILGLILSGRELYSTNLLVIFSEKYSVVQWLFGAGVSGIMQYTDKFSAEIDIVDIFVWLGSFGVFIMLITLFLFIWHSYQALKISSSQYAPAAAVSNIILISLSFLSGHIITSGILGFGWALLNGMVLTDIYLNRLKKC